MLNGNAVLGALANLYTHTALMNLGDQIMGLDLAHGGYIPHGYQIARSKMSVVAHRFESAIDKTIENLV